jgi:hypothetical protein
MRLFHGCVGVINYTNYSVGPVSCFLKKNTCLTVLATMLLTTLTNLAKDRDILLITLLVLKILIKILFGKTVGLNFL